MMIFKPLMVTLELRVILVINSGLSNILASCLDNSVAEKAFLGDESVPHK